MTPLPEDLRDRLDALPLRPLVEYLGERLDAGRYRNQTVELVFSAGDFRRAHLRAGPIGPAELDQPGCRAIAVDELGAAASAMVDDLVERLEPGDTPAEI